MTEPIKWHESEDSSKYITYEYIERARKMYNPVEFRQHYLNEPQFTPEQNRQLRTAVDAGRGIGKTTRDLQHICELLVGGETKIYCKIKRHRDFGYICKMFTKLIYYEAYQNFGARLILISIEKSRSRITTNFGALEFFVKPEEEFFRGKDRSLPVVSLIDY